LAIERIELLNRSMSSAGQHECEYRLNRSAVAAQPGLVLSGAGTNDAATSALPVTQDSTTAVIYDKLDSIDSPHGTTITLVGVPHESSDLLLKAPSVI
jgi:hypothetical protein